LTRVDRVPVVLGDEVGVAADRRVHLGAADFGHRRRPAGDRLDHLRAGEEHVRVVARHDHEVHQCRRVGCAARTGTADHGDLRHHPGQQHVGVEHVAVAGQGIDPLLNACAARILEGHHRHADLQGMAHDAGDLARLHLAQGAGDDAEVLAEGGDLRFRHSHCRRSRRRRAARARPCRSRSRVRRMQTEFLESALGKQRVEALASRQQTLGVQRFQLLGTDVFGQPGAFGAQLFYQLRSYRHLDS
jgi:hypothetical protein